MINVAADGVNQQSIAPTNPPLNSDTDTIDIVRSLLEPFDRQTAGRVLSYLSAWNTTRHVQDGARTG